MEDVYSPVLYEEREVTIRGLEGVFLLTQDLHLRLDCNAFP